MLHLPVARMVLAPFQNQNAGAGIQLPVFLQIEQRAKARADHDEIIGVVCRCMLDEHLGYLSPRV